MTFGATTGLFMDLYELTMARAYFELGMSEEAVFSLFVRKLPPRRNYLLACGLETLVAELERFRFMPAEIAYLASLGLFPEAFLHWLEAFRFEGDVFAMAEGTPVFANEPLLEVVAPLPQAQLIETIVLNQIGLQTVLASKAARVVEAARGRQVIDFGSRRAQGVDAALQGARAFHIAGIKATSNVEAGRLFGIPVAGTVAHSFIEACGSEAEAFERFARIFPGTTLLVDTYDTIEAVRRITTLAQMDRDPIRIGAIRLDSGDLLALSREARRMLDGASLHDVRIFASGGLDEDKIDALLAEGAPIDAFGVGTDMSVSGDVPALDIVYKLTEYGGCGRMKLSEGKRTLPGRKQVFREWRDGALFRDVIAQADERLPGTPLLACAMQSGVRVAGRPPPLADLAAQARHGVATLPPALRSLTPADPPWCAQVSPALLQAECATRDRLVEVEGLRHDRRGSERGD